MITPRWRVDCRRDLQGWRTVLYEVYDRWEEALTAQILHVLTGDWDSVEVVPIGGADGESRRMLTAGARVRCAEHERDNHG